METGGGHLAAMLACSAQDRSLQPGFEDKDCSVRAGVIPTACRTSRESLKIIPTRRALPVRRAGSVAAIASTKMSIVARSPSATYRQRFRRCCSSTVSTT